MLEDLQSSGDVVVSLRTGLDFHEKIHDLNLMEYPEPSSEAECGLPLRFEVLGPSTSKNMQKEGKEWGNRIESKPRTIGEDEKRLNTQAQTLASPSGPHEYSVCIVK